MLSKSTDQTVPVIYAKITLSTKHQINFSLPIFVNKFISPQDQQKNSNKFDGKDILLIEFTLNDSSCKIDKFIKNPAPESVPLNDVMNKIMGLCS